jgi:hypothetical protein
MLWVAQADVRRDRCREVGGSGTIVVRGILNDPATNGILGSAGATGAMGCAAMA